LAILIVAGTINAVMYVLSLYFQDPSAFGMSALEAGLATLPAATAMIAVTPFITPVALKIGTRNAIALGFGLAATALAALVFVTSSWAYTAFVVPLAVAAVGLGLANGPASSVSPEQVGQASGISNMARYIGGSLAVAAVAAIFSAVTDAHSEAGEPAEDALAAGVSRASLLLAIMSAAGIALALLMARHRAARARAVDRVAAAAIVVHTIPTEPDIGWRS